MCLECYLHLSGRGAGGQEVRQERDHLYHVLCMTSGLRLNIYMCLKVMQIEEEREGASQNFLCRQSPSVKSVARCISRSEHVSVFAPLISCPHVRDGVQIQLAANR